MTYSDKVVALIQHLEGVAFDAAKRGMTDAEIIQAFGKVLRAAKKHMSSKR